MPGMTPPNLYVPLPAPVISWGSQPTTFVIVQGGEPVITIKPDGRVVLGADVPTDEAAKCFWNALERLRGQPPLFPDAKVCKP